MISFRTLLFFCFYVDVFTYKFKDNYNSRTSEALIFGRCKKNYQTIVIDNNSKYLDLMWLQEFQELHEQFYSMILYNNDFVGYGYSFNAKQVDAVLITISSLEQLEEVIEELIDSIWWNVMIPVYVLHLPGNDCRLAMNILQQIWEQEILTSYFLCIKHNEVRIYTYNPFTNRAPNSWNEVEEQLEESPWTLYRQKYQPGIICQEFDFDRTERLDGFPITIVVPRANKANQSLEETIIENDDLYHNGVITEKRYHFVIDALTMALNVRPSLYVTKKMYYDERTEKTYLAHAAQMARNEEAYLILVDYFLSGKMNLANGDLTRTYPLGWYEMSIATDNRGYRTLAEKIWNFYGIWTILYTILVLLITFVVIWFTENRKTAFAVFEILRLFISQGLYTRMNTLPLRIFFITILIYFLIIQATFNGHLAKFLTKPELRRQVETREDLRDLDYTNVIDSEYVRHHLSKTIERKTNYKDIAKSCLRQIVYHDPSVACIFNYKELFRLSKLKGAQNLYVSKQSWGTHYSTFVIEKNWSLLNRVNIVIMLIEEMGFRQFRSTQLMHNITHKSFGAEARSKRNFRPIKLENLMFAFSILGIGLISAMLSFCVEVFINREKV